MPFESEDEDLEFTIAFALSQFGYQPPRTPDISKRERYYRAVARAVAKQMQFSWTIVKKPPMQLERSSWKPDNPVDGGTGETRLDTAWKKNKIGTENGT